MLPLVTALVLSLTPVVAGTAQTQPDRADLTTDLLVYHQLTSFPAGTGSVGFSVLSADGTTGVFSDAPGSGEDATPNRIFTIDIATGAITEVDAYQSLCFCGALVDLSRDGATVVSSDSVQVRLAGSGGGQALVTLASNEITTLALTGAGETVFFLVRRDTSTADGATAIPRGIWAVEADGTELRQVIGADAVATAVGVPIDQTGCCFHADGHPLDVADAGDRIVFSAYAGDGEHVVAADGDGGNLHVLRASVQYTMRVAISGDGATVAYDVLPLGASTNELGTMPSGGGEGQVYSLPPATTFDEPLQLNADGSQLLVSPNGLLIDTDSGEARLLAVSITGVGGNHEAVLTDGLARATMDADGERFLYVMRTVRCADCVNLPEQLATLDITPADLGEAPVITDASIEPVEITLERASQATAVATVETPYPVLGVGFAAILPGGIHDPNLGHGLTLLDDGQNGDATAGDGVYRTVAIEHAPIVAREPDTGPRTIRIAAEVENGDGLRHATAIEIGTLTVTAG
jgi:hypothetical protein